MRSQECKSTTNTKVDLMITAASLEVSAHCSVTIGMNEQVNISEVFLDEELHEKFKGNSFKPADISPGNLPTITESDSVPVIIKDDTNTP